MLKDLWDPQKKFSSSFSDQKEGDAKGKEAASGKTLRSETKRKK